MRRDWHTKRPCKVVRPSIVNLRYMALSGYGHTSLMKPNTLRNRRNVVVFIIRGPIMLSGRELRILHLCICLKYPYLGLSRQYLGQRINVGIKPSETWRIMSRAAWASMPTIRSMTKTNCDFSIRIRYGSPNNNADPAALWLARLKYQGELYIRTQNRLEFSSSN